MPDKEAPWIREVQEIWTRYREGLPAKQRENFDDMLGKQDQHMRPYGMMLLFKLGMDENQRIPIQHRGDFRAAYTKDGVITKSGVPQNTTDALVRSHENGFMAEIDVQVTAPEPGDPAGRGTLVSFHDANIG